MNKTKLILAGIGGASGLAVLVLGFFVWQAFSARTAALEGDDEEGVDGLETVVGRAETLSRKPVYPCAASVTAVESNRTALTDWMAEARKAAAVGDRIFGETTPAAFKAFMVGNVAILRDPTNVTSRILKPDFAFGPFKEYIAEGKLPADGELAVLQRTWDDVVMITELLGASGVTELTDVQFAAANRDQGSGIGDQEKKGKTKKGSGNNKAKKGVSKGSDPSSLIPHPSSHSYVFTFTARPTALIKAVNALGTCKRFIVVEDFSFSRPVDAILEALAGEEKKDAAQSTGGRRGRRNRRSGEAESLPLQGKTDAASKPGVVTDPLLDAPLSVVMTVTVHDFRSLEDSGEGDSK